MTGRLQTLDEAVLGALGRLDRRVVPGLTRRPEIVVVLIGLLFLGAGTARFSILAGDEPAPAPQPVTVAPDAAELGSGDPSDGAVQVGPQRGEDVEAYTADRHADLDEAVASTPGASAVAVVSFDRYLTPVEAEQIVSGLRAFAGRYRIPVNDPFAEEGIAGLTRGRVGLDGGVADALVSALQEEARHARAQAAEFEELISSAEDPEFAEAFQRDRNRLLAAAAMVGQSGCACIYAVEVQGRLAELGALRERAEIRLVDVAPPDPQGGAVAFTALLPEERREAGGP